MNEVADGHGKTSSNPVDGGANNSEISNLIDWDNSEDPDSSYAPTTDASHEVQHHCKSKKLAAASIILAAALYLASDNVHVRSYLQQKQRKPHKSHHGSHKKKKISSSPKTYPAFPAKALLGVSPIPTGDTTQSTDSILDAPYDPTNDFQYGRHNNRTLLYWEEVVEALEQYQSSNYTTNSNVTSNQTVWSNLSNWGPCYPRAIPSERRLRSGYSYSHRQLPVNRNWTLIVQSNSELMQDEDSIVYPQYRRSAFHPEYDILGGDCRPGFLIIGQGKCGTSSLYHYLTGHPRVLPASEKQVHYFLYHTHQSLKWYYSHFPTIESFLGRGALMTGEASPGYMPYPSVLEMIVTRLSPSSPNEVDKKKGMDAWRDQIESLPKIIAIVREPIDRAISSYKYNYITPALEQLKHGQSHSANGDRIPGKQHDVYYLENHMFSLEELARAELQVLRSCLKEGGMGEQYTIERYAKSEKFFFYETIQQRMTSDLPNFIHLDGACYQETSSISVPRVQWTDLGQENKILALPNLQLVQSIIGRGLYNFPLEWWYEVFGNNNKGHEKRIQVVCNEDMADNPVETMENITRFLGLPEFEQWKDVTFGKYNVGKNAASLLFLSKGMI